MGLGFSKLFIIILFIAVALSYWNKNWITGAILLVGYVIIKVIWNILR